MDRLKLVRYDQKEDGSTWFDSSINDRNGTVTNRTITPAQPTAVSTSSVAADGTVSDRTKNEGHAAASTYNPRARQVVHGRVASDEAIGDSRAAPRPGATIDSASITEGY